MRGLALVLGVLALLLVPLRLVVAPIANRGLGYVAKVTRSQVFVGGLSPDAALAEPPVTRIIQAHVDVPTQRLR